MSTTLLLALVVVAGVGLLIVQQVRDGLLHAKSTAALAAARADDAVIQSRLDDDPQLVDPNDIEQVLFDQVQRLAGRGSRVGIYDVLVVPPVNDVPLIASGNVDPDSVPLRLRNAVTNSASSAWSYIDLRHGDGTTEPGVAVGSQLGTVAGPYQIYHLFPLTPEAQTLHLVQRTVFVSGLVLVVLLAAIAAIVTRQVVTPVRYAARSAQRLAAGRLQERMAEHGEDDLARLAKSFNRMADALQKQISRLEELSRMQRRFVSDVSHELRTPLTTVRMAAEVLHGARASFAPEVARSAELLQAELDRFEALLVDLLEISRYDAGAAVLEAEPADVREVVRAVVVASEPLAERRGTRVVVHVPDEPVVADIDVRRIERVLRNLVCNAIDHSEGLPVEVTVAADDDAVAVNVCDHGVGLAAGEAAHVFQRFWRADPSRARSSGGTGLGLAIALEDTRLHNGWLQAAGDRGRGSIFRLTVPRHSGATLATSPLPLDVPEPVEATNA